MKKLFITYILTLQICLSFGQLMDDNTINKEFSQAKELYVLDYKSNTTLFTSSQNENISLAKLSEKYFPNKKIIIISKEEYNKLPNVSSNFFITICSIEISNSYGFQMSTRDFIGIAKGKIRKSISFTDTKYFCYLFLNFTEISNNQLAERLEYAISGLSYMLDEALQNKNYNRNYHYRRNGLKDFLQKNTLYLDEQYVKEKYKNLGKIAEIYPYPVKIVTKDELNQVIKNKTENALFADFVYGQAMSTVNIYIAKNGNLIFASNFIAKYSIIYEIEGSFFHRLLEENK